MIMNEDELWDSPPLVYTSKQELPNAINPAGTTDTLGLHGRRQQKQFTQVQISHFSQNGLTDQVSPTTPQ